MMRWNRKVSGDAILRVYRISPETEAYRLEEGLDTNATNDHSVVIWMANQVVEVGTVCRPSSLRVELKFPPKP
jgi:hypothetical protein